MLRAAAAACAALILASCASAPTRPVAAAAQTTTRDDYTRLYRLEGETASLLAEGRLAPAKAVAFDQRLTLVKAELDSGLRPQAEADLSAVAKEISVGAKKTP